MHVHFECERASSPGRSKGDEEQKTKSKKQPRRSSMGLSASPDRDGGSRSPPPPPPTATGAAAAAAGGGTMSSRPNAPTGKSTGFASGASSAPPGHTIRRAKTMDESTLGTLPVRRRSMARSESSFDGTMPPRRPSNFSEYSLSEARDILNPRAQMSTEMPVPESSSLASLSLAFALLPAIAGSLFKNGHSVVTDIMLLGLGGVFLHWSVTQPWVWYHAAQQVRIQEEADDEAAAIAEEDSESDRSRDTPGRKNTNLDDVPEEEDGASKTKSKSKANGNGSAARRKSQSPPVAHDTSSLPKRAALRELYIHEVLAMLSCFAMPVVSAALLHYIRAQLSRPSEGLVSNYNLTIFLLISELRAFSHALKLVQSRTLHLQRVIHGSNPYAGPGAGAAGANGVAGEAHMEDMIERLTRLEARSLADEFVREQSRDGPISSAQAEQNASVSREVRNAIQPELDALNRAVRRYEKKATMLQYQTDARFSVLDARMDDAIALAAVAAKNSRSKNMFTRAVESGLAIALLPFNALLHVVTFPLRSLLSLNKKQTGATKPARGSRAGKAPQQQRYNGERVLPRVIKR